MLVREEIELAKAEVTEKATSIARGTAAVAAGAVFGVFAIVFVLNTLAWGLDASWSGAGDIWIGFAIVTGVLLSLALLAFLFAWRKLRVGPAHAADGDRRGEEDPRDGRHRLGGRTPDADAHARRDPGVDRAEPRGARQLARRLRGEVVRLTDWRSQLRLHQQQAIVAAGVAGFVLGGGIAGLSGLVFGGRRARSGDGSRRCRR